MKTNNMVSTVFKALTFMVLAFGITNCNKSNNNNGYVGVPNGYRLVNNVCYQTTNGVNTPVGNPSVCTQMNAPMYQMNGSVCYQIINGQQIPQQNTMLCNATGTGVGVGNYVMSNNICYQVVNGQYIPQQNTALCTMNGMNGMYGMNGVNGMTTQVCNGQYYHPQYGNVACGIQYYCQGPGFTNQYGQQVYCQ